MRYAVGLFTVIPVRAFDVDRRVASRAMAAMPWMGLLLGATAGLLLWVVAMLTTALLGAVVAVALLALVTGALHLDGVADTADGLGSRKPRDEALAVMRRSDIGPMGVVTLLFVLLADTAALASIGSPLRAGAALAAAVAVSRMAVTVATVTKASARSGGFGALFVGVTSPVVAVVDGVLVLAAVTTLGWLAGGSGAALVLGAAALIAGGVAWLWGRHLVRRLGGWTGDTFGSLIEITQAAFLLVAAVGTGLVGWAG